MAKIKTYFVQAESGKVKIGSSTDPVARVRELQVGNHERLFLRGYIEGNVETRLHRQLSKQRLRPDGEWFRNDECLCQIAGKFGIELTPQEATGEATQVPVFREPLLRLRNSLGLKLDFFDAPRITNAIEWIFALAALCKQRGFATEDDFYALIVVLEEFSGTSGIVEGVIGLPWGIVIAARRDAAWRLFNQLIGRILLFHATLMSVGIFIEVYSRAGEEDYRCEDILHREIPIDFRLLQPAIPEQF